MALQIVTLNANGLRDENKRMGFLQWLGHLPVDFVCLQETHALSANEATAWFSSYGWSSVVSPCSRHSCGTVLLFRLYYQILNSWFDSDGRFVLVEFSFRNVVFRIVSLYAPNRNPQRDDFLTSCVPVIDPSVPTFVCGDFNTVFSRVADRRGVVPSGSGRESCGTLLSFFQDCCIVDIWRSFHPDAAGFTSDKPDGSISSRIDFIGCPYAWAPFANSCSIIPCPFSDHSLVSLNITVPEICPRGPGKWKLNISVLKDDNLVSEITTFWSKWRLRKSGFASLQSWWDAGKSKINGLVINHCTKLASERAWSRNLLVNLASHLKSRVDSGAVSCFDVLESVRSRIAEIDLVAAKGAQVRSRVKWVEDGEQSTSYFLSLEKKNSSDRWIAAMRGSDGIVVSDISSICSSWRSFYLNLFTACSTDIDTQRDLLSNITRTLPPGEVSSCEGLLCSDEIFTALNGMARGKTPGSDGLPAEFYLAFWDTLGGDLVDVLNASFQSGLLSKSQRTAIISLSFKKGDRLLHKNWRPISLLNVDYKLCARALAGRLLKVIHHVVSPDQTCGVPGRYIGENVALLRDMVDLANERDLPVAILSLDQEKAFDRVDWQFLFSTLSAMGFGHTFISWVKLLYSNVRSTVFVNGYFSDPFSPSRGVRQGCPLSPLLYVLTMEVLACNIRCHPDISGICLPNVAAPLPVVSLYADDTSVISTSDVSTCAVFDTYNRFERGTGSILNLDKCEGLWLGSWRGRVDSPVPIQWTSIKIKVLGVFIGNEDLVEANWRPRISAVEKCLSSWRSRSLSFGGKALVVNALALSRIWYVASLVYMPPRILAELETLVFKLFWSEKRDLVARNVVKHPCSDGGFNVVGTRFKVYALLVQWVRRYLSSPNVWVSLMTFWFFDRFGVGPMEVFSDPFSFPPNRLPPFYAALLKAWRDCGGSVTNGQLTIGSLSSAPLAASSFTCKSSYQLLLDLHPCHPHCIDKFFPSFGSLDWPMVWKQHFFLPLDRKVIDLNWRICHGVPYTAERLSSFGYAVPLSCFCGYHTESLEHLFFSCPLAQSGIAWIQTLLSTASPLAPSLCVRHLLFGFDSNELLCVPRIFPYLLCVCKFFIWSQRNDFRFRSVPPSAVRLLAALRARVKFYLPLFSKRFVSSRRRRYFTRQWGASGLVGSFSCGSFVVHF